MRWLRRWYHRHVSIKGSMLVEAMQALVGLERATDPKEGDRVRVFFPRRAVTMDGRVIGYINDGEIQKVQVIFGWAEWKWVQWVPLVCVFNAPPSVASVATAQDPPLRHHGLVNA